jgi:hypothetical protein
MRGDPVPRSGWLARDRLLRRPRLVGALIAWGILWLAVPRVAETAPLGPPGVTDEASGDLERAREELEARVVRERLTALGASPADVDALLARLSPEERTELAARAPELAAGGNPAAPVLAVAIIVGLLLILVLELIGRRVVSRPSTP